MIVPAKRKYVDAYLLAQGNVKPGETFSVDSGLWGSWTVAYIKHDGDRLLFRRAERDDWPEQDFWFANESDAAKHIYTLVPENPNYYGTGKDRTR